MYGPKPHPSLVHTHKHQEVELLYGNNRTLQNHETYFFFINLCVRNSERNVNTCAEKASGAQRAGVKTWCRFPG